MKFAYVHIPKTAGTTIVNIFKLNHKVYHKDKNYQPQNIKDYDICFGHFYPEIYFEYSLVTWFRQPIDRAISHYSHWKNRLLTTNKNKIIVNPGKTKQFDPETDLISFVEQIGNILVKYTSNNLNQFEYIGIVERMEHCLVELSKYYNIELPNIVPYEIPINRKGKLIKVFDNERKKLKELLKEDIQLYNRVRKRYE